MNNSRYVFIGLVFCVFVVVVYLFKDFWLSISIASLMAVATANLHVKVSKYIKKRALSSLITTFLVFSLFFAPLVYASFVLFSGIKNIDIEMVRHLASQIKTFKPNLPEGLGFLEPKISEFLSDLDISGSVNKIIGYASSYGKLGLKFFVEFGLICVFYFFANFYGKELMGFLKSLLPMSNAEKYNMLKEISNVMAVVFYSIIFNAILQGVLFAIIASAFGFDGLLFGILYAFASLIPVVGGLILWLPLSSYVYFMQGDMVGAIAIAIYSVVMISVVADTLVKPLVIKWISEKFLKTKAVMNEMLVFFSMIAGISTFGFWGIILGPAILALFMSVIKIYVSMEGKND